MKKINIGGLPFGVLRDENLYYVDKTLLIKDLLDLDGNGVYLFTRPRRFGKSTNISMLDAFFNIEYKGNTWFDGLAISEHHKYDAYKNAFPVIYLDLKDSKSDNIESFEGHLRHAIKSAYRAHKYLLDSMPLMNSRRAISGMCSQA